MDRIIVDVEIQKTIAELPQGWDSTELMGVSCACVWEYQTQRMRIYGPDDVDALQERLLVADQIGGFNIFNFDFPVIWGNTRQFWTALPHHDAGSLKTHLLVRTNDLLRRIWISLNLDPDHFDARTHGGWSLDKVAEVTIGAKKIGYGGDAPVWFQQGNWAKVANYCADDVALERDLSDFIDRYGYVIDPRTNRKLEIFGLSGY